MPIHDAYGNRKKNEIMTDTWRHLYPEPGSKHAGTMLIALGTYGHETIIKSNFSNLDSSPQRYELEHTIFSWIDTHYVAYSGVFSITCTLWFFKNLNNTLTRPGKIIKIKIKEIQT